MPAVPATNSFRRARLAALAALAVAAATLLAGPPAAHATTGATTGATAPHARAAAPSVVDLSAAPRSSTRTGYLIRGRRLIAPDGSRVRLPRRYHDFAVVGSRILASWDRAPGRFGVDLLRLDGSRIRSFDRHDRSGLVTSRNHRVVAWASTKRRIRFVEVGHRAGVRMPILPKRVDADPVSIEGKTCFESVDGVGCTIVVDAGIWKPAPRSYYTTSHGIVDALGPALADAAGRKLSVLRLPAGAVDYCSRVRRWSPPTLLWSSCTDLAVLFSQDARRVVTIPAGTDGLGPGQIKVVRAATGDEQLEISSGSVLLDWEWHNPTTLLVVAHVDGKGVAVFRVRMDGTATRMTGYVDRDLTLTTQWVLPAR